jgi:hypothetical protein
MAPHQMTQAAKQISGAVRIQLISSVICPEFDEAITSFHRRHPRIAIELDAAAFGSFVAEVPPPLAIGSVTLADRSIVKGFVTEDITALGGWRAYIAR